MLLGERIRILARFLFSSFNVVSCPPAQRAHAQAGARGGYNIRRTCVGARRAALYISSGAPPGIDGRGQCLNVSAVVPTTVPYTVHGLTKSSGYNVRDSLHVLERKRDREGSVVCASV